MRLVPLNLIDKYEWTDIWHPDRDSWFVGSWDKRKDLCILKICETEEEAERYLSPEGKTLTKAILKAERKLLRLALNEVKGTIQTG
jgi:hypothetical protein